MALPFAPDSYYRPPQNRISELLMRSGEIAARRAEQSGQIWSNAAQQVGGAVASGIQSYQEEKAAKKAAERDAYQAELLSEEFSKPEGPDWNRVYSTVGPERAMKIKAGYGTLQTQAIENEAHLSDLVQKKAAAIIALPEPMRPAAYTTAAQNLARLGVPADQMPHEYDEGFVRSLLPAQKQPEGFSLSPGQRRFDASGKEIAAAPEIAKPAGTHVVGGNLVTDEGKVLFTAPKTPGEGKGVWVTRNGAPTFIQESQIGPGDAPYESARTGVKKMPAGSAQDLADLQTSLDEIGRVRTALSGAEGTGMMSRIGAALPLGVTEFTGWGESAKERQATIDRVKQIIGKALEGGVLRKEDELKYTKILPVIGDPPEVAKAKLDGLQVALTQKRQRSLESLADAGYDTEAFTARDAGKPIGPKPGERRTINGQLAEWDGKGWLPAK